MKARSNKTLLGGALGLVLAAGLEAAAAESAPGFRVIVNPAIDGNALRREILAQVYLGGADRWGDGTPIVAVDLSGVSPVRHAFSSQVLGKSVDAVKHHWLRRISSGQRPPLSKASDDEVIAFVASQPGAVGYVSAAAAVPPTVREVVLK